MEETTPRGVGGDLGTVCVDGIPIKLTTAGIDIHLVGAEPPSALPGETNEPEDNDAEEGKLALEETLDGVETILANGSGNGSVELERVLVRNTATDILEKLT